MWCHHVTKFESQKSLKRLRLAEMHFEMMLTEHESKSQSTVTEETMLVLSTWKHVYVVPLHLCLWHHTLIVHV